MIVIYGKGKVGKWLAMLLTYVDIDYVLMDDVDKNDVLLQKSQYIIVSPWIKPSHVVYRSYGDKVLSELNYLWLLLPTLELPSIKYIGISWTNGKSTTSWVMYQLLQKLFPHKKIWLTGNFDVPLSQTILSIMQNDLVTDHLCVVEASSFMLYNLTHFVFDYALLLTIARDHLDWHETMDNYILAKMNICQQSRHFVTSESLYKTLPDTIKIRGKPFYPCVDISLTLFMWSHNIYNLSGAVSCIQLLCKDIWISPDINSLLADIKPLPHRLEIVKEINWITIIDDGISTSAQSLSAALHAIEHKCVAIVWGYDNEDDYSILASILKKNVSCLVCIGSTQKIFSSLAQSACIDFILADTLIDAISQSLDYAKKTNTPYVLFSPWAKSFDMFTNVYDRIDKFTHAIASL